MFSPKGVVYNPRDNLPFGRNMFLLSLPLKIRKTISSYVLLFGYIMKTFQWEKEMTRWWFQICFIFTPIWGYDPILTKIFQMGLVQPPTRFC